MQRYFVTKEEFDSNILVNDFHHIKNVTRSKVNDKVIVCYSSLCKIVNIDIINETNISVSIIEELSNNSELQVNVTIAQALVKSDKMDHIVQKSTELGVSKLIPLKLTRSIVKYDAKKEKNKLERWNKIAKEAAEQSHRFKVPLVDKIQDIKSLKLDEYDTLLVSHTVTEDKDISNLRNSIKEAKNILFIIGPEGGLDNNEIDYLLSKGFKLCSLGKRILRTETASSYILSVISYENEL